MNTNIRHLLLLTIVLVSTITISAQDTTHSIYIDRSTDPNRAAIILCMYEYQISKDSDIYYTDYMYKSTPSISYPIYIDKNGNCFILELVHNKVNRLYLSKKESERILTDIFNEGEQYYYPFNDSIYNKYGTIY